MRMLSVIALLVVASLAVVAAPAAASPWFCHARDCPAFTTVSNTSEYEVREYSTSKWMATAVWSRSSIKALNTGFKRLYDYIGGDNINGTKIDMAVPVLTRVEPKLATTKYLVGFYLPNAYQEGAAIPRPNDPRVKNVTVPDAAQVAVRSFGGYASPDDVLDQVLVLQKALCAANVSYDPHGFYYASYDAPFKLTGRHNEVWLGLTGNSTDKPVELLGAHHHMRHAAAARSHTLLGREQHAEEYPFLAKQEEEERESAAESEEPRVAIDEPFFPRLPVETFQRVARPIEAVAQEVVPQTKRLAGRIRHFFDLP